MPARLCHRALGSRARRPGRASLRGVAGCLRHLPGVAWVSPLLGTCEICWGEGMPMDLGFCYCTRTQLYALLAHSPASIPSSCCAQGVRRPTLSHLQRDGPTAPVGDSTGIPHTRFQGEVPPAVLANILLHQCCEPKGWIVGEGPRLVCGCPQHPHLCAWPLHTGEFLCCTEEEG